jgi:nucleoside-diphosphate-sugar epimerase
MISVFVVGCGGLGRQVAAHCLSVGTNVSGLVRAAESARQLERLGIHPWQVDLDRPPLPVLPTAGAGLLYLAPPPEDGTGDPRMEVLLAALSRDGAPRRLVYVSTSGVYGDCAGAWVDETWTVAPGADRARRRVDAERQVREWAGEQGVEWVILRVAGIYGPGRLPLERLRRGLPLVRSEEAPFTNRIHEADLARACVAALERPVAGEVINVSDGHPGTMAEYFDAVADLAGLPRAPKIPLLEAAQRLSPGMLSYMQESRRLDNRKLRERLGVELLYPTLAAGLASCLPGP